MEKLVRTEKFYPRQVRAIKKILEGPDIKHYNVLTFDVAGRWLEPKGWLDNNEANRKTTIKALEGVWLEGASDIGAALDALARPGFTIAKDTPVRVYFYSDGRSTWGEADVRSFLFDVRAGADMLRQDS